MKATQAATGLCVRRSAGCAQQAAGSRRGVTCAHSVSAIAAARVGTTAPIARVYGSFSRSACDALRGRSLVVRDERDRGNLPNCGRIDTLRNFNRLRSAARRYRSAHSLDSGTSRALWAARTMSSMGNGAKLASGNLSASHADPMLVKCASSRLRAVRVKHRLCAHRCAMCVALYAPCQ